MRAVLRDAVPHTALQRKNKTGAALRCRESTVAAPTCHYAGCRPTREAQWRPFLSGRRPSLSSRRHPMQHEPTSALKAATLGGMDHWLYAGERSREHIVLQVAIALVTGPTARTDRHGHGKRQPARFFGLVQHRAGHVRPMGSVAVQLLSKCWLRGRSRCRHRAVAAGCMLPGGRLFDARGRRRERPRAAQTVLGQPPTGVPSRIAAACSPHDVQLRHGLQHRDAGHAGHGAGCLCAPSGRGGHGLAGLQ